MGSPIGTLIPYTHLGSRRRIVGKLLGVQYKLQAKLLFKTPRLITRVPQLSITAPGLSGQRSFVAEVTQYTPGLANNLAPALVSLAPAVFPQHNNVLTVPYTHQKKRILRRVNRRKSRFVRFIPFRVRRRLLRSVTGVRNRYAVATPSLHIPRYLRHFYTKGSRIYITRFRTVHRIAAHRLAKQKR